MTWCVSSAKYAWKIVATSLGNANYSILLLQHILQIILQKKIVFTLWFLFFNSSYLYIILVLHSRMDFHERHFFPKVKQSPKAWTSCPYWHNMSKMPFLKFYSLLRKKLGYFLNFFISIGSPDPSIIIYTSQIIFKKISFIKMFSSTLVK